MKKPFSNLKNFSAPALFHLAVLLTFFSLPNAACRQTPSNVAAEPVTNHKSMEYHLENAVFDVPPALQDITVYTFGKPDKSQSVEIINSERAAALDTLAAEITDQAVDGLGLNLVEERAAKIDDMPARVLAFTGEERGTQFRQFFVLAIMPPGADSRVEHLEIKYLTKEDAETANVKLERMIKSARRTSESPPAESPSAKSSDGYTRRFAGIVSLDIPADLRGGGFQFTPRESGSIITDESVTFEVSEISESETGAQTASNKTPAAQNDERSIGESEMEEDINTDLNSGGEILDRSTKDASTAEFKGTILSYAVNNSPPWEKQPKNKLLRRAYLQISETVGVRVVGRADNQKQAILEQNFDQIVKSVRKK